MTIIDYFNKRMKLMNIFDMKLAQLASALLLWVAIKVFPVLTKVDYFWLVIPLVLIAIRLFYVFFVKKDA
ncbi:MAG TPA: hypothetical protein ENK03_02120 [Candidatus Cloacimonetes bacterium]|nr:hypothetical protein [Candidatus Cloacimonadota bacterium]